MKKLLIILLTTVLLLATGCEQSIPTKSESVETTEITTTAKKAEKTEATTEEPTDCLPSDDDIHASFAPESFASVEELQAYINNNSELKGKEFLVPRYVLDGFELGFVDYFDNGAINITYEIKKFVYDKRFDEIENGMMSVAYYNYTPILDEAWSKERIRRLNELGFELLKINGKDVYFNTYYSDSGLALQHHFRFIEGDKSISIVLPPPAVEGLTPQQMGKYLEMVSVNG